MPSILETAREVPLPQGQRPAGPNTPPSIPSLLQENCTIICFCVALWLSPPPMDVSVSWGPTAAPPVKGWLDPSLLRVSSGRPGPPSLGEVPSADGALRKMPPRTPTPPLPRGQPPSLPGLMPQKERCIFLKVKCTGFMTPKGSPWIVVSWSGCPGWHPSSTVNVLLAA